MSRVGATPAPPRVFRHQGTRAYYLDTTTTTTTTGHTMTLPPIAPLPPTRAFDTLTPPVGSDTPTSDEVDQFTLAQACLAEVVSLACATIDTVAENPDLAGWIYRSTQSWGADHARQALFLLGTVCQAYGVEPDALAEMGRIMLHGH